MPPDAPTGWPSIARALLLALAVAAVLAGCASPTRAPSPRSGAAPATGTPFYQDDGPPDRVPGDLAATPDAVPRVEPLHPFANRPYVALGHTYSPDPRDRPFKERGVASWYGRQFHGNKTASGERYDMFGMTAAHPTLPIPSYARVTHLDSGRSVIVRVNDRGPFLHGRIIDLSYAAAVKLGIAGPGSGRVEVVRLLPADIARGTSPAPVSVPAAPAAAASTAASAPLTVATAVPEPSVIAPNVTAGDPDRLRWAVQFGVFAQRVAADALRDRLGVLLSQNEAPDTPLALLTLRVEPDGAAWRVLVGEPSVRADALALAGRLARLLQRDAVLVAR
jgi:rare lipoprotein A